MYPSTEYNIRLREDLTIQCRDEGLLRSEVILLNTFHEFHDDFKAVF